MSEPERAPGTAEQIRAVTAELDRSLRRLHVARGDRQAIVDEVRGDLQTAAAEGVSPQTLIGPDIDAFAREAVGAGGYRARPRDYGRVLAGATLAAGVAVVAAYWLIVEVLQPALASWFDLDGRYPSAGPVVVYGAIALLGLLAVLASALAGRPARRESVTRSALLAPVGAAAGIAAAVTVGRGPGYSVSPGTVTVQVLLTLAPVLAALAVARWWALRTTAEDEQTEHATYASR